MNQFFDFRRFTLLVGKHWSENRKKYLLGIGAMIGLLFFWFGFVLIVDNGRRIHPELQALTYFVGLGLTGCFYGSILFNELSSGPKAMNYLSFPASHLEKLACGLLYGVVIFFVAYTVVFYLVDIPMVLLSHQTSAGPVQANGVKSFAGIVNVFSKSVDIPEGAPDPFTSFILGYLAVQSAFILGSVYFPKFSFLKTTISLLVVALLIVFFVSKVWTGILPPEGHMNTLTSMRIYENGDFNTSKLVALPKWLDSLLMVLLKYAFAPIFWVVTYFRFKEKQV